LSYSFAGRRVDGTRRPVEGAKFNNGI